MVVVVSQVDPGPVRADYALRVSGGTCQPVLHMDRLEPDRVWLRWTTAAVGYGPEATDRLAPIALAPAGPPPVVVDSQNTVTNPATGLSRFYRLRRP